MRIIRYALAAMLSLAAGPTLAQGFSATSAQWRYGPNYREPGIAGAVPKHILTLTHASGGKAWSNFVNMDLLFSVENDPANRGGGAQAVELYGIYRGSLSLNGAFDTNAFTLNPVLRDVSLQVGFDANTKNTAFAPAKKLLVMGPKFHFNVPGFLTVAVQYAQEWNNNGIVNKSVSFDPTWETETVWRIPLDFTGLPLAFEGFGNVVGPKGKDGFGNKTKTEFLTEPRLSLDVGKLAFDRPNKLDVSLGYQYWLNKFGNNADRTIGAEASTVFVAVRYQF